jgi:hypothetical protein
MSSLSKIEERVQEGLALNHSVIISSVVNRLIKSHNDLNCNCDYCKLLHNYVRAKKDLTRTKRIYWSDNYVEYTNLSLVDKPALLWERLENLQLYVLRLKRRKDSLKTPI